MTWMQHYTENRNEARSRQRNEEALWKRLKEELAVPKLKLRNSRKSRCALFFMLFGHMADKAVIWIAASLKKKKKRKKNYFCGFFHFFFFQIFLKKNHLPSSFFTDVSPANKEQKQIKTAVITMLTSVLALISPGLGTLMWLVIADSLSQSPTRGGQQSNWMFIA